MNLLNKEVLMCSVCNLKYKEHSKITFHSFPFDIDSKMLWVKAIAENTDIFVNPTRDKLICSMHFKKSDFWTNNNLPIPVLRKEAVPSIFKSENLEGIRISVKEDKSIWKKKITRNSSGMHRNTLSNISEHNYSIDVNSNDKNKKTEYYIPQYFLIKRDIINTNTIDLNDILKVKKLSEPILFGVSNTSTVIKGDAITSEKCYNLDQDNVICSRERDPNLSKNFISSLQTSSENKPIINRGQRTSEECTPVTSAYTKKFTCRIINQTLSKQKRTIDVLLNEYGQLREQYTALHENIKELKKEKRRRINQMSKDISIST